MRSIKKKDIGYVVHVKNADLQQDTNFKPFLTTALVHPSHLHDSILSFRGLADGFILMYFP